MVTFGGVWPVTHSKSLGGKLQQETPDTNGEQRNKPDS